MPYDRFNKTVLRVTCSVFTFLADCFVDQSGMSILLVLLRKIHTLVTIDKSSANLRHLDKLTVELRQEVLPIKSIPLTYQDVLRRQSMHERSCQSGLSRKISRFFRLTYFYNLYCANWEEYLTCSISNSFIDNY